MDINNNEKEIKSDERKNYNSLLIKIKHKPIILEYIFSFAQNRAFVIIEQVSRDEILKSSLKKTFENSKKKNNLSLELNTNINKYMYYRKILEDYQDLYKKTKNDFNNANTLLNNIVKKNIIKEKLFNNKEIIDFMRVSTLNETKLISILFLFLFL